MFLTELFSQIQFPKYSVGILTRIAVNDICS